jgi:hypothetical protein
MRRARPKKAREHSAPTAQPILMPAAPGVIATSTIDDRTLEVVATKDGAPVGRASYSVSEDGRSLTSTTSGTDASGRAFDQVIVFDRA